MSKPQSFQCTKRNTSNKFSWTNDVPKSRNNELNQCEQVTSLITDLAVAINEKMKVESENAVLKIEIQDHKDKVHNLEIKLSDVQSKLTENLAHVQDTEFKSNELEKKVFKINAVQESYAKERDLTVARENELRSEIENLKTQLNNAKVQCNGVADKLNTYKEKNADYKDKLKFSISLITKLNAFLNKATKMQSGADKNCQTDERISRNHNGRCRCPNCSLECEDLVISELFFKENPFTDTMQDIFFN